MEENGEIPIILPKLTRTFPYFADVGIRAVGFLSNISNKPQDGLFFLYSHSLQRKRNRFAYLIDALREHFEFVSTEKARRILSDNTNGRYIHISFDDGFKDNLEIAKILTERNISATFFLTTAFIDKDNKRLSERFRNSYDVSEALSWNDVRIISELGHEIGSHSVSHARMIEINKNLVEKELRDSKVTIEDQIGKGVTSFSFPYGRTTDFDEEDIIYAYEAGYQNIFTTDLKRYDLNEKNDSIQSFCRFGFESSLSYKSVNILMNGLLQILR